MTDFLRRAMRDELTGRTMADLVRDLDTALDEYLRDCDGCPGVAEECAAALPLVEQLREAAVV